MTKQVEEISLLVKNFINSDEHLPEENERLKVTKISGMIYGLDQDSKWLLKSELTKYFKTIKNSTEDKKKERMRLFKILLSGNAEGKYWKNRTFDFPCTTLKKESAFPKRLGNDSESLFAAAQHPQTSLRFNFFALEASPNYKIETLMGSTYCGPEDKNFQLPGNKNEEIPLNRLPKVLDAMYLTTTIPHNKKELQTIQIALADSAGGHHDPDEDNDNIRMVTAVCKDACRLLSVLTFSEFKKNPEAHVRQIISKISAACHDKVLRHFPACTLMAINIQPGKNGYDIFGFNCGDSGIIHITHNGTNMISFPLSIDEAGNNPYTIPLDPNKKKKNDFKERVQIINHNIKEGLLFFGTDGAILDPFSFETEQKGEIFQLKPDLTLFQELEKRSISHGKRLSIFVSNLIELYRKKESKTFGDDLTALCLELNSKNVEEDNEKKKNCMMM